MRYISFSHSPAAHAKVEDYTNIGRTDLEVTTGSYIYIFEFKYNRSAREAWLRSVSAITPGATP